MTNEETGKMWLECVAMADECWCVTIQYDLKVYRLFDSLGIELGVFITLPKLHAKLTELTKG